MTKAKKIGRPYTLSREQEREVVRLRRKQHLSIAELGRRFHCSATPIHTILSRRGLLEPGNATQSEKEAILRLSKQRQTRHEIARFLGRSRSFVENWQRKLDCQWRRKLDDQAKDEICAAYQSGLGQERAGKACGFSGDIVRRVLAERGIIRHKTGGKPFELPPDQLEAYRADVLARKHFCVDLAKKHGLSKHNALKLAKEILGVPTFLRGELHPPLSSPFPQRRCAI